MNERPSDRTVLVVDDEKQVVEALTDLLEDDYNVIGATSPMTALHAIETNRGISVVLCDQRMPRMSGDDLLARTRTISPATRLLITGYADLQAVIRAVNEGKIFGYISKPWDPDALRIMVHKAVEYHDLNQELEHERTLLHNLMVHSPDGIIFKDRDQRYHRMNAAASRMLGLDRPEAAIGKRPDELLSPERAHLRRVVDTRILVTGEPELDVEERVEQPDGRVSWYSASIAPVRDARQRTVSLIALLRDVTARKEIESQLRQAMKMDAIGQLTGGIAHDFNNLLGVVIGNLDLLQEQLADNASARPMSEAALDAALRGAELTKRLLAFARRQDLKPTRVDIGDHLDDLLVLLSRTLGEDVEIRATAGTGTWPIEVDIAQLDSVIVNLAVNARDAMPGGGLLTIGAENVTFDSPHPGIQSEIAPGDYVRISVSDTGTGIPAEILGRVFEPFFTTKPVGKGTGLGLSMVLGFTRQSNGHVTIDTAPGRGTTVNLYLPRTSSRARRKKADGEPALPNGRGERILVVEDNAPMREIVVRMLSTLGYRPLAAGTAADALAVLDGGEAVDLVFSDVVMPGSMSGFDLADEMRVRYPAVSVLLSSGFSELDRPLGAKQPRAAGRPAMLGKPYRREDLAHAIRKALDER